MRRREISGVLFGSVAGSMLVPKSANAQSCAPSCYAQTPAESAASVTPNRRAISAIGCAALWRSTERHGG